MATLLEEFQVAPPPGTAEEVRLPLTLFDLPWVPFHPIRRLLFYEISPCSKDHFLATIVPKLRESLSLALKHYSPLAGKFLYPSNSDTWPLLRFLPEDYVPFSVFESDKDFDSLVGDFPRDADLLYDFIPQMPPAIQNSDCKLLQVLAIQVTLFQGRGICIGAANHHAASDATSIIGFFKSWASISNLGGDDQLPKPVLDRSVIKDPGDIASKIWNQIVNFPTVPGGKELPTGRVRATYRFSQLDIKKLKDSVLEKDPVFPHLSSFVVVAAYIWSYFAKSLDQDEEINHINYEDDDPDFFLFAADCRSRVDPPVPENYLGNCVSYGLAQVPHADLIGDGGFFAAAQAIASQIKNKLSQKDKVLSGYENSGAEIGTAAQKRFLSVAGSARVDIYGLDFGWGGPVKYESPSIDQDRYAFSLCRAPDGGLELALSLPATKMAAIAGRIGGGGSIRISPSP